MPDYQLHQKGGYTEQLNIEGKRSGEGFVSHKAKLVSALSRALADRVLLVDLTIGRKGFLGYLKALGGSNIVKVVPFRVNPQTVVPAGCGLLIKGLRWYAAQIPVTLRTRCGLAIKPH